MPRDPRPMNRRPRKPEGHGPWGRTLLFGLLGALMGLVWAGVATGHLSLSTAVALQSREPSLPVTERRPESNPSLMPALDRPMTLLVMGTDAVGSDGRASLDGNTDTMLLFRLDPRLGRIRVVSIPRDTRTRIPGHSTFKINAANAWGGPELAARTVSGLLGVEVDRFFLVSLKGLIASVDALGGLEATVPKRLVYHDWAGGLHIDLQPGAQRLSGKDVEALLRFRHDDLGDIGRIQRQQGFLLELVPQVLHPSHLLQLPHLLAILKEHSETNLTPYELLQIAGWIKSLPPQADLQLTVLPGRPGHVGNGWYWLPDATEIDGFLVAHYGKQPSGISSESAPSVTLFRPEGIALKVWRETLANLEAAGYRVRVDDASPLAAETQVISQKGDPEGAQRLVSTLGSGRVLVAGVGDLRSDYTVRLGADWLATLSP